MSQWQPKVQLFNLVDDVGEKRDLSTEKPEMAQRLKKAWEAWGDAMPPRSNPPAPKTAPSKKPIPSKQKRG